MPFIYAPSGSVDSLFRMLDGAMLLWWILTVSVVSVCRHRHLANHSRVTGPQVGLRDSHRVHRASRGVLLRPGLSGTASGNPRGVHRGPLASSARVDHALRRRRWDRHRGRSCHRRGAGAVLLAGFPARVRARFRVWVGVLPSVRHARHGGRVVPTVPEDDVSARAAVDEPVDDGYGADVPLRNEKR